MKFRTILADPAWLYWTYGAMGRKRSPDVHYTCTEAQSMEALPVAAVADTDAVLFMWCTWPKMAEGLALMAAWGFEYKTGIPWLKMSRDMLPRMGTGYHTRVCSEYVMIGTKGSPRSPEPWERLPGIILARQGEHSAKPDYQYDFAELYDGPYLEIFARRYRPGWVSLGNELDGLDLSESLLRVAADEAIPVLAKEQGVLPCFAAEPLALF